MESGKDSDALDPRTYLAAALGAARSAKCPVIVAKLDLLSRDVAFIAPRFITGSAPTDVRRLAS